MVRKNRPPSEVWALRMLENGLKKIGKIYVWKPTKAVECGRQYETKFTECILALICGCVGFVIFLFWFVGQLPR